MLWNSLQENSLPISIQEYNPDVTENLENTEDIEISENTKILENSEDTENFEKFMEELSPEMIETDLGQGVVEAYIIIRDMYQNFILFWDIYICRGGLK